MPQESTETVYVVDVRSDTVTKPTPAMRHVMAVAEVGDSVLREDPTVNRLERRCAEIFGKEDAVYLCSGSLCNLIAIMAHCPKRGVEFIAGDRSHTFFFEQGGASVLAGVQCSLVSNLPDGTFCLKEVERKIRHNTSCLEPETALIVVENTNNLTGGKVLPMEWLDNLTALAKKYNLPVHMDGARIFNAVVHSGIPAKRIVRDIDSVCFCLSKGLGCPMGSVLCGSKSFIAEARRIKNMIGAGVRQGGILAAAGLYALDEMVDRLHEDHDRAYQIAKAIDDIGSDTFQVDLNGIHTNIVLILLNLKVITANEFIKRLSDVKETDEVKVCVQGFSLDPNYVRLVLHCGITDEDVRQVIDKIRIVIKQVHEEFKTHDIKDV